MREEDGKMELYVPELTPQKELLLILFSKEILELALEAIWNQWGEALQKELPVTLLKEISEGEPSVRLWNVLNNAEIIYFFQLAILSEKQLLLIRGLGRQCLSEIREMLESEGLELGMYIPPNFRTLIAILEKSKDGSLSS